MLVLLEPRLGLTKACELIGVAFGGDDQTLVAFDERHITSKEPKWVRMHDGRRNHNHQPSVCRSELKDGEFSGTDIVGICAYLHYPDCVCEGEHVMDLPGSVNVRYRGHCAYLKVWGGQVKLSWNLDDYRASPRYGASSCRE
jgi:hypothetical protein